MMSPIDNAAVTDVLPARTAQLLKEKGFTVSKDGATARYRGKVEIEVIRRSDELELCFILESGATLYAKPSGVLLLKESD